MTRSLLARGLLAGAAAGLAAAVVAFALGEPQIERAIEFEAAAQAAQGTHEHADPLVARGVQRTAGLATGTVTTGVALGGLLALAFAFAYGRFGLHARATAALLAAGAFATVVLVPFLAYPAGPPGVGDPATIRQRTVLHLAAAAIALAAAWAGVRIRRRALVTRGAWTAGLLGAGAFVALVAAAVTALPSIDEVPRGYPAETLWSFRLASLATNATLWAILGLGFGAAAERLLLRHRAHA